MKATKEKLIEICDELFEKKIIGRGEISHTKYDVCNGHVNFTIGQRAFTESIRKNFEELGYKFESAGFSYYNVYWKEDTSHIDDIFNKYK